MTYPDRRAVPSAWQLARLPDANSTPAASDWIPASVPGGVQLDWAMARGLPEINYDRNVERYDGLEDSYWLYRTAVPKAELRPEERLFFRCEGVDFQSELRIGDRHVSSHQGLGASFEADVTDCAPGTRIEILVHPAPKRHPLPADRSQASHVTKPAVSYGWDWHPRFIPLGICGETGFAVRPATHIREIDFTSVLSDALDAAEFTIAVESNRPEKAVRWSLRDPAGQLVLEGTGSRGRLERPRLWWTHDHGAPDLYTLDVGLDGGERVSQRVGFRRVRLVMHAGGWDRDPAFPKSRNDPPMTIELNGRRIFGKGSNWVTPDLCHGRENAATYRPLLQLARDAHFNLLRCWGGAAPPKDVFFAQCDELGLLVWQEFPLACNLYPDTPDYLAALDAESRRLIRRGRRHPCLGLWVGGNELFCPWSQMTDQSLPLRLLNRNCYDLDPLTPFLPTAPVEGMGHGDYRFLAGDREIFAIFQEADCTAYSEFGCPGASPVDYLREFIPAKDLWPPRPAGAWTTHHAFDAWPVEPSTWLSLPVIEKYFGPSHSLEQLVERSGWLQSEGYRAVFEEARRQQPRCALALNWCYNEPWPTAANNSIVNWPARPKPAYFAVQSACRPLLATARIPRFQWNAGESFHAELWLLNDTADPQPGGQVEAAILAGGVETPLGVWDFPSLPPLAPLRGPRIEAVVPATAAGEFTLRLTVRPHAAWSNAYRLSLRAGAASSLHADGSR